MNWLSLDEEREGWKFFWHSILFPMYFWLFNIFFLLCVALFPNKYIFENTLSFIPYIISFRLGIIATFGALILTLYINVRTETKGWSNPKEYKYSFAYQKYAKLISYFLDMVWFMNFIYVVWRDANIPEGIKKVFLAGVWEDDNHGKFIGADVAVNSDIPLWVFLFLSWFVLSISVYMSNNEVSTHHTIMVSYKEISSLYLDNRRESHKINETIIKIIIKYIYDSNENWAKLVLKSKEARDIWEEIYKIFPNTSVKGYHYLVNGVRPLRKRLLVYMSIFYVSIAATHALLTASILTDIYRIDLNFGLTSILSIVFFSTIFYVLIILFWFNTFLDDVNILVIYSKVPWAWIKIIFSGIYILMIMMLVFLSNFISILYSYKGGGEGVDIDDMFQTLLKTALISVVLLFISHLALIWNQIDKMKEYHYELISRAIFRIDDGMVNQNSNINLNIFIISRIIYLHMRSKNIYSEYLKSIGRDESSLNGDLHEAYKVASRDSTKFPRLVNIYDIFN